VMGGAEGGQLGKSLMAPDWGGLAVVGWGATTLAVRAALVSATI